MAVTLMYVDPFKKKNITELETSQLNDASNLENLLLETFQKGGVDRATDPTHLLVRTDSQYFLLPEYRAFEGNETVIYSDIPAQNNAYIYDRKDGIDYFFHTSEKEHAKYPHVHARYSGKEISIYFSDFSVKGKFESIPKQKQAVAYVKENLEKLNKEWERISNCKCGHVEWKTTAKPKALLND